MDDQKLWYLPQDEKIKMIQKGITDIVELLYPPNVPVRIELDISVPPTFRR